MSDCEYSPGASRRLRSWRWSFSGLVLTLAAAAALAGSPPVEFVAPAAEKRSPGLLRLLGEQAGPLRVWVFFQDKGHGSVSERSAAIREVAAGFDARAVRRRELRGRRGLPRFDFRDLPVHDAYVEAVASTGARLRVRSRWVNAVSVVANAEQIAAIARLPFVDRMQPVARGAAPRPVDLRPSDASPAHAPAGTLDYGRSTDQLAQIRLSELHDAGFTGAGVIVGVLDTGFRRDHEAFQHPGYEVAVLAEYDFVDGDPDAGMQPGDASSQHNHGTLILGTLGAYLPGELVGGAYDASFVLAKTEDVTGEYQGEEDNFVAGLEFVEAQGADLSTSSLGYIDWYTQADLDGETAVTTIAVNAATDRGLHCVTSAGNASNDGDPATSHLLAPGDAPRAIAVGAVTATGVTSSFSSDGPTADGRVKPEVLALGSSTSTVSSSNTSSYVTASGTSLSAPLVASVVACLIQAHPSWSVDRMRDELFLAADFDPGGLGFDPLFVRGYGIVDALGTHLNATGLSVSPAEAVVSEGPNGGPFVPPSASFTVRNDSEFPVDYLITADRAWVDLDVASGTLAPGAGAEVQLSLLPAAASLAQGRHDVLVDFVNMTDHDGDTVRTFSVYVDRTIIAVGPQDGLSVAGPPAGPFPQQVVYTVTSDRVAPVTVAVSSDVPWVAIDGVTAATSFSLDGVGASRDVLVGLSPEARLLPEGTHTGTVSFVNLTSDEGSTTRTIELTVGGLLPVLSVSFDSDPGWTTTGDWAFGQPLALGSGNGDPAAGFTGANVYGYNLAGDYGNDLEERYLTSVAVDASGWSDLELRYQRWLGVQSAPGDSAAFQVSTDGKNFTTIWSNVSAPAAIDDREWTPVVHDLASIADGQTSVYLRWVMGATDGAGSLSGWNLDDVELIGTDSSGRVALLLDPAAGRWTPIPGATGYDLVQGDLSLLRSTGGDFSVSTTSCLANDVPATSLAFPTDPLPGQGTWTLVRALSPEADATYDALEPGQLAARDAGIEASGAGCP